LAILHGGVFVTNDKRHFAKVKQFGHIMLLEEYGGKICPHAEHDEAPSCLSKKQ
jgi:hypothetical protein